MGFEKGHPKLGGRAKGTPNRHTQSVKDALRAALDQAHPDGAKGYFLDLARSDPRTFMGSVSKLIPTAIEAKVEHEQTVTIRKYSSGRESTSGSEEVEVDEAASGEDDLE